MNSRWQPEAWDLLRFNWIEAVMIVHNRIDKGD
jgi:hypothetical protein